jgi:hypothetical protein
VAIALRAASAVQSGTPGSTTVTGVEPTGTVQDDVIWALWICDTAAGTQTISLPTGGTPAWTQVASRSAGLNFRLALGYVVRGASAPALGFTMSNLAGYFELFMWSLSGCDTAAVVDNAGTPNDAASSASAPDPPSATVATATDWALTVMAHWGGSPAGSWTAPTGYTLVSVAPAGGAGGVASKALSGTGTEDPGVFGGTPAGTDVAWAETVTVKAAAGGGGGGGATPTPLQLVRSNIRIGP